MIHRKSEQNPTTSHLRDIYKSTRILMTSIIAFDKLYNHYKLPRSDITNSKNETYPLMQNRILSEFNKKLKEFTNIFITKKLTPELEKFNTSNPPKFSTKLTKIYEDLCYRYNRLFTENRIDSEKLKADLGDLSYVLGVEKRRKKPAAQQKQGHNPQKNIPRAKVKTSGKKGGLLSIAESVIENNIVFESLDFTLHPPGPLDVKHFRKGVRLRKSRYISKSNEKKKRTGRQRPPEGKKNSKSNYFQIDKLNKRPYPKSAKKKRPKPDQKQESLFDYVNMRRKVNTGKKQTRQKSNEKRSNSHQEILPLSPQPQNTIPHQYNHQVPPPPPPFTNRKLNYNYNENGQQQQQYHPQQPTQQQNNFNPHHNGSIQDWVIVPPNQSNMRTQASLVSQPQIQSNVPQNSFNIGYRNPYAIN